MYEFGRVYVECGTIHIFFHITVFHNVVLDFREMLNVDNSYNIPHSILPQYFRIDVLDFCGILKQGLKSIGSMGAALPGRATLARKVGLISKENKKYLILKTQLFIISNRVLVEHYRVHCFS